MADRRIDIDIVGNDKASHVFRQVSSSLSEMNNNVVSSVSRLSSGLQRYNSAMNGIYRSTQIALGGAGYFVYRFTKDSVEQFADFERQHAKTMGAIATNYDKTAQSQQKFLQDQKKLKEQSLQLGTFGSDGKGALYNPTQVSSTQTALAKAGFNANQIPGVTPDIIKFAGGNDLSLETATEYAVNIGEIFGVKREDYGKMLDKITKTADISTIDVPDLFESMKYAGPIASSMGRSMDELLSMIAVMGNAGLKGSMSGTGIQSFFTRILDPVGLNENAMKTAPSDKVAGMAEQFIVDTTTAEGKFKPMTEVTQKLDEAMSQLNDKEQAWFAHKLFGLYQMKAAYTLGRNGGDTLKSVQDTIANQSAGTNDKKWDIMVNSAWGKQQVLRNAFTGMKTDVGYRLSPFTSAILDELFKEISNKGNYKMDFSSIKTGLENTSQMITEQYGAQIGDLVRQMGTFGISSTRVMDANKTLLPGFGLGYAKLLGGDIPGAIKAFRDGIDGANDGISQLPPELQSMAEQVRNVIVTLSTLAGINFAARLAENITKIGKFIDGVRTSNISKTVTTGGNTSPRRTMNTVNGETIKVKIPVEPTVKPVKVQIPVEAKPIKPLKVQVPIELKPIKPIKFDIPVEAKPIKVIKFDIPIEAKPIKAIKVDVPIEPMKIKPLRIEIPVEPHVRPVKIEIPVEVKPPKAIKVDVPIEPKVKPLKVDVPVESQLPKKVAQMSVQGDVVNVYGAKVNSSTSNNNGTGSVTTGTGKPSKTQNGEVTMEAQTITEPPLTFGTKLGNAIGKGSWIYALSEMFGITDWLLDKTPAKRGTKSREVIDDTRSVIDWTMTGSFVDDVLFGGNVKKTIARAFSSKAPQMGTTLAGTVMEAITSLGAGGLLAGGAVVGAGTVIGNEIYDQHQANKRLQEVHDNLSKGRNTYITNDGEIVSMPSKKEQLDNYNKHKYEYGGGESRTYITATPPEKPISNSRLVNIDPSYGNKIAEYNRQLDEYRNNLASIQEMEKKNKQEFSLAQVVYEKNTGQKLEWNSYQATKPAWDKIFPSEMFGTLSTLSGPLQSFTEGLIAIQPAFRELGNIPRDKDGNIDAIALQNALMTISNNSGQLSGQLVNIANNGESVSGAISAVSNSASTIAIDMGNISSSATELALKLNQLPKTGDTVQDAMNAGKLVGQANGTGFDFTTFLVKLDPLGSVSNNTSTMLGKLDTTNLNTSASLGKLDQINTSIASMPPPQVTVNVPAPNVNVHVDSQGNITQTTSGGQSYVEGGTIADQWRLMQSRFGGGGVTP